MSGSAIAGVTGLRVWDSRGRPTVEAEIILENGASGRAIAPAGASRGSNEAVDLRDGDAAFGGLGVDKAVAHVNGAIANALTGMDIRDQAALDRVLIDLDGTPNKSRLGGNAMIAVSMAALHAAAAFEGLPLWRYLSGGRPVRLPLPEIQIFGGGAHAARRVDIQDFMVMPIGADSFKRALEICAEIYAAAGRLMDEAGLLAGVADEGGWWPAFDSNEAALEMLVRAIEGAGFKPGEDAAISLDVAASEFGRGGVYKLALDGRELDSATLIDLLKGWLDSYPIVSIEDPLAEDDDAGMRAFTAAHGHRIQIIGDDYLVTDAERIGRAAADGICNAALIKPNQAGTVTETLDALNAAKAAGWSTVVSARSGETEDVTIAHLAVGWDAGQLKVGSFARSERMAKWNEVLRIEQAMGADAEFAGGSML